MTSPSLDALKPVTGSKSGSTSSVDSPSKEQRSWGSIESRGSIEPSRVRWNFDTDLGDAVSREFARRTEEREGMKATRVSNAPARPSQIQKLNPGNLVPSDHSSACMNRVRSEGMPETFLVSRRPSSKINYYSMLIQQEIQIAISLEDVDNLSLSSSNKELRLEDWKIEWVEESTRGGIHHRRYQITNLSNSQARMVDHFTLKWINRSIPHRADFDGFMESYLPLIEQYQTPNVHLHCIGGHGRSGTLLLLRALMQQPQLSCAEELLKSLRTQRSQLVETREQYAFALYQASLRSKKEFIPGIFSEQQHPTTAVRSHSTREETVHMESLLHSCRSLEESPASSSNASTSQETPSLTSSRSDPDSEVPATSRSPSPGTIGKITIVSALVFSAAVYFFLFHK